MKLSPQFYFRQKANLPCGIRMADFKMVHDLPQPGLLPKEKENRSPSAWKFVRLDLPDDQPQTRNLQ
jgi:hypothetical protein